MIENTSFVSDKLGRKYFDQNLSEGFERDKLKEAIRPRKALQPD